MFKLEVEEQTFSLKPMNCPESTYVYRHALRSYRDLPLRVPEIGRLHRNERSGTLTGLFRVRQITHGRRPHLLPARPGRRTRSRDVLELVREFYKLVRPDALVQAGHAAARLSRHASSSGTSAEHALHEALKRQRRSPTS